MKHNSLFYFSDYNTVALMIYFFSEYVVGKVKFNDLSVFGARLNTLYRL